MSTNCMPAHAKVKSAGSQLLEGQDVRLPDIFDMKKDTKPLEPPPGIIH
jgi:hypothetical protein